MDSDARLLKITQADLDLLNTVGWLSKRGPAFQAAVLKHAMLRHYEEGEALYLYGDAAEGLFAVLEGSVKMTVPADDGQEFVAHREGVGFWIGDLAMLSDQTRLISVLATSPTRVLFIPGKRIADFLDATPEYYRDFYTLTHENTRTTLRILANLAVSRADQRLALRLLHLEETLEHPGGWIVISQQELSAMVAVSLPTLQRILQVLFTQGMVEMGYGKLRITDRGKLLSLCQN